MRRSKISPSKIANTGVNPYTGEYLSAGERKLLFQKRNVSSANVFKKSGALVKTTPSTITPDINVTVLSKRVFVLENDVSFLAKALNKEAELEKKAQKQYEKDVEKVEEKKLRSGEEKQLEKKITKGLISPVKAVGKKAGGVLGTLMELFMTLLGGWLTNQGLEAIKANAEGNIGKLESIAAEVGKTLLTVAGIFALLNGGILGIVATIGAITAAIIAAPFKFAFRKLRELVTGKPKPPGGGKPGAGGGKPGAGGGKPGAGKPGLFGGIKNAVGGMLSPSPGSISRFSDSNLRAFQGKANLGDKLRLFYRGGYKALLKSFMSSGPVKGLKALLGFVTKGPGARALGYISRPFVKFVQHAAGLLNPRNLKKIGSALGKARVLSRLLGPLLAVIDIQSRSSSGMSPAQAIIPALLKALMTSGGAVVGGSVPIPGLNILTSFAGGYIGSELGNMVMGGIDGMWDKSWDNNLFKGFNKTVMSIGEKDPTGLVSKIFPYEGKDKKYDSKVASVPAATGSSPAANTSGGTDSNPSLVKPTAQVSSPSSPSMSVPGPVSGGGNTTVIYKKVGGSGGQMQGQPLKSGSATDVPLIASADPSNFYTMYSQLLYNVVG